MCKLPKNKKCEESSAEQEDQTIEETVEEAVEEAVEETVDELPQQTQQESDKAAEWENKYIRLFAEFDNFKKRSMREKDARYADAVIDTTCEMLNVLDNLQRALLTEVTSEDAKKLYEGVALVEKQMKDTLAKLDVTEIKAVGEQFDPNIHNAVMHIEDESIDDNTVVEEFMKGYIYKDTRVVRHSMVKVAN